MASVFIFIYPVIELPKVSYNKYCDQKKYGSHGKVFFLFNKSVYFLHALPCLPLSLKTIFIFNYITSRCCVKSTKYNSNDQKYWKQNFLSPSYFLYFSMYQIKVILFFQIPLCISIFTLDIYNIFLFHRL